MSSISTGSRCRAVARILLVVASLPGLSQAAPSDEADDAQSAAVAFFTAIADREPERALENVLEPDKLRSWVESQCELSGAFERWNQAVAEKLGDDGKAMLMPNPLKLVAKQSHDTKVSVAGETAEYPVAGKAPMIIRRSEGKWKLDLYSAYQKPEAVKAFGVADGDEVLKLVTLSSTETTAMINAMAEDVENDRLTTVDEMRKRLRAERNQIAVRIEEARKQAAAVAEE